MVSPMRPLATFVAAVFVASPALAEVCDTLGRRSTLDTLGWTAGPFVACVVTTLLVLRGSTLAAAVATLLSVMGFLGLKDTWDLVQLAQAEPCGPSVLREAQLRGLGFALLFAVPNGLWSWRRVKAARAT
jgi:hypothetical protein